MTQQERAIERGYTHFIEMWRSKNWKDGIVQNNFPIPMTFLTQNLSDTKAVGNLKTICVFLIKPKNN